MGSGSVVGKMVLKCGNSLVLKTSREAFLYKAVLCISHVHKNEASGTKEMQCRSS